MKNKIIISSILTIAMCFSLIAGSTFALFTSESKVDVVVNSATVDVDVDASALNYASTLSGNNTLGAASLNDNVITLTNLVPGDYVTFTLTVTNKSTVAVNYRALVNVVEDKGLLSGLVITYNNAFASDWKKLEPTTANVAEVVVTISLPEDASNDYQNTSCKLAYVVEAVQGNVDILDNLVYKTDENGNKVISEIMGTLPEELNILEGTVGLPNKMLQGNTTVKEVVIPATITSFGGKANATGTGASGGFFYGSAVEKVTLPEGLTEIPDAAFNGANNLKEVNIPTTVTKVGINSFAYAGLETLTVPATITEIGYGAFRGMANLKTVVIEGNATIANYAFRSCSSLETVVLLGDDVTFLTGGQIFTRNDAGSEANGVINVYVANETVKERLLEVTSYDKALNVVVGNPIVENDTEINDAINEGVTTLILGSGNYILPDSASGKTLTIIGNGDTVIATQDDGSYEGCDYSLRGATVTFENVTINTDSRTYTGYAGLKATYNNCTINGTYTLYDDSTFNNCTFNVSGDVYNIWTWGATNATFNNCTFNSDGKAVLLYGGTDTNLTLNGCTFNDKGGLTDKKAAVEIGDDYGRIFTLTVTNTVVNGYEINDKGTNTGTTLWGNKNSMSADRLTVIVDGVKVYGN